MVIFNSYVKLPEGIVAKPITLKCSMYDMYVFFCDFVRANVDKIFQHHGSHMGNVHLTISGIDVTIHLWEYWRWFISLLLGLPH